jgi:hypothetical protein
MVVLKRKRERSERIGEGGKFCPVGLNPRKPDSPVYETGQSNFF